MIFQICGHADDSSICVSCSPVVLVYVVVAVVVRTVVLRYIAYLMSGIS